ncbi:hypothetical protein HanXRQr2_Chr07g0311981 [Helianthus annuus]|uniref:Uncharacterized protein n=2 Tax=Helianthus annuus TaxID=4232 RepID=A0A9K3INL6_HELAN|nr:hypothetical protein HanXRQr2_Chr07g0311981 [Helianthus annuus]
MDEIAETPRVRRFIPIDSPWHRLFDLAHMPTYRELLVEFISSFTFHPPGEPVPIPYPGFFQACWRSAFDDASRVCGALWFIHAGGDRD